MIEIPVYNAAGESTGKVEVDEQLLGGEVRPALLKQAYVRIHANKRQGTSQTKSRGMVEGSTRKLYKQKGSGNARRGSIRANIMRGGGRGLAKKTRSYRQGMPIKMRRLANRNAVLAKAVDGEIRLAESLDFDKPSTKQFAGVLDALKIDRSCLLALGDVTGAVAKSARNHDGVKLTQIDRLNAFDLLSNRYVLAEKAAFEQYIQAVASRGGAGQEEVAADDAGHKETA